MIHPLDRRDDLTSDYSVKPQTQFTPVHLGWTVVGIGFLLALSVAIILGQERIAWERLGDLIHFLSKIVLFIGLLMLLIAYRDRHVAKQTLTKAKTAISDASPEQEIIMLELVDPTQPERLTKSEPKQQLPSVSTTRDLLRQMSAQFPQSTAPPQRPEPRPQ